MRTVKLDLERKRKALNSAIQTSMGTARGSDHGREVLKDPFGTAVLTHDDEVTAAVVERRAQELAQVDSALHDIESGRYGICRDCDEAIAPARLRVLPFATRCVTCQAKLEGSRLAA